MDSYKLPFPKGTRAYCTQGNNNTAPGASHSPGSKAAYAFDFSLAPGNADEGELIIAASGGTVAMFREDTPDYVTGYAGRGRGNYLVIRHTDGTCDVYMHLKQGSVSEFGMSVGTPVRQGQPICRLGKTGFCFGAHLHFQRQVCGASYYEQSILTPFEDVAGGIPQQGNSYISQNELKEEEEPLTLKQALEEITTQRADSLLNPSHALQTVALQQALGAPLSGVSLLTGPDSLQYHVQIFERDTLYLRAAPPIDAANVKRMSQRLTADANDPWGLQLWRHTYSNVGVEFQPRWSSHQFVLSELDQAPLGAPLGGGTTNGVHTQTIEGKHYEAEVYVNDTIYWVAGIWGDIRRLSQLQQAGALKNWLSSITVERGTTVLKPAQALTDAASRDNLGAPLSAPVRLTAPNGQEYHVQVFAHDTLYLRATPPIDTDDVHRMSLLLIADPDDLWGNMLWEHTYANVGVEFQSRWASHQFVLNQLGQEPLGAPLGGGVSNGVHIRTIDGKSHEIEIYARDTIYWIPPAWGDIRRLSDL